MRYLMTIVLLFGLLTLGMSSNASAHEEPHCQARFPVLKGTAIAARRVVRETGKVAKGAVIRTRQVVKRALVVTDKVVKGTVVVLKRARCRIHNFVYHPECRPYVIRCRQ